MAFDDVFSGRDMTTDSPKYRTPGLPPSSVASAVEAALGLTAGEATAHLLNTSSTAGLEESLTARTGSLLQAEIEASQRFSTASISSAAAMAAVGLRGISAASSYEEAARADFFGATGVMMASQAGLADSAVSSTSPSTDRIAAMSHSTAAAAITADAYTNSLSAQFAGTGGLAKNATLSLLDSQLLTTGATTHISAIEQTKRQLDAIHLPWAGGSSAPSLKSYLDALNGSSKLSMAVNAARIAKNSFSSFFGDDAAEALKRITAPASAIQTHKDWYEQTSGLVKAADSLNISSASNTYQSAQVSDFLDRITGLASLTRQFEETLKAVTVPSGLYDSIAGFTKASQVSAHFFTDPLAGLGGNLERFDAFRDLQNTPAWRVMEAAAQAATARADIDERDESHYQEEIVADLQRAAVEVLAQPNEVQVLESILSTLEQLAKSSRQTAREKWLFQIWYPLFVALLMAMLAPTLDFYIKRGLERLTPRETEKAIKREMREQVGDLRLLSMQRFISVEKLTVTMSPKAKAPIIGHLKKGAVVRLLDEQGSFTLVSWRSEDGNVEIKGWVFTRYLQRFS